MLCATLASSSVRNQWHTLSVDNDSKGIELEHPASWEDQESKKPGVLRVIRPEDVHPDLFKSQGKPLHIHVKGDVRSIPIEKIPTLRAAHAAPNCASMSSLAANKHPRESEDEFVALRADASGESIDWDDVVSHFTQLFHNQRKREMCLGVKNEEFGFTFEQPMTKRAREQ